MSARMTFMSLLDLQHLHKSYGALSVTQDFSLTVEAGDLVGILGPNGAGKTTLFNQITGTVLSDAGAVWFDGQNVTNMDASGRCQLGIARSFQVPHPFVGMTVFENILVGATLAAVKATLSSARWRSWKRPAWPTRPTSWPVH